MCFTVFVGVACVRLSISTAGTKVVYEADMHDLIEAENNNAKSLRSPTSSTAAVCFSGHVRTLIEMAPDIERYLLQAFPRYEAFFLLNLKDQYTSWRINRFANNTSYTVEELLPVLKNLGAVIVEIYDDHSYKHHSPSARTQCYDPKPPPGEWQRHGSQMWSISHCFDMVFEYEKKKRAKVGPYRWVVRARPDAWPGQDLQDAIEEHVVGKSARTSAPSTPEITNETGVVMHNEHPNGKIWTSFGTGSDPLFITERSAAPAISSVWSEFLGNKCETLPPKGPCSSTANVKVETKTECLIDRHLRRFAEVSVVRKEAIRTRLRRPATFHDFIQSRHPRTTQKHQLVRGATAHNMAHKWKNDKEDNDDLA